MFVLDTDHVVISQQQSAPEYDHLIRRVRERDPTDFFVSIISFHEQVMGWNVYISRAKDPAGVVRGYERLQRVLSNFLEAQVLAFDDAAADVFEELRRQRIRIGTMDLRIASIALSRDMTVLSRNLADFRRVPGLKIEDWTLPESKQ
jgi:tRNA(fMet)-specific endonuclease VapC